MTPTPPDDPAAEERAGLSDVVSDLQGAARGDTDDHEDAADSSADDAPDGKRPFNPIRGPQTHDPRE